MFMFICQKNITKMALILQILKIKFFLAGFVIFIGIQACIGVSEEDEGVRYANPCEVCKIVTSELEARLEETGKSDDVIQTTYSLSDSEDPKYRKKYRKSELRLVESLDGLCNRILDYNIHKERTDSTRFAKGMSQTFRTLHGLVNKGVKVELGIPHELWDKPSVEITHMKTQCESLLEENEEDIEDWFFNHPHVPLKTFLCSWRVLKGKDDSCLTELAQKGDLGEQRVKQKEKDEL